jgi:hypothetical protein
MIKRIIITTLICLLCGSVCFNVISYEEIQRKTSENISDKEHHSKIVGLLYEKINSIE